MPCSPFARGLGSLTSTASENPPRKATKALHFSARPPSAGEARPGLAAACVAGLETPHRSGAALGAPGGPSPPGRADSVGFRGVTGRVCQQPPPAPQPRGRGGGTGKGEGWAQAHTSRGLPGPGRSVGSARRWGRRPHRPLLRPRPRRARGCRLWRGARAAGSAKTRFCIRCAVPRPRRNTQLRGKDGGKAQGRVSPDAERL